MPAATFPLGTWGTARQRAMEEMGISGLNTLARSSACGAAFPGCTVQDESLHHNGRNAQRHLACAHARVDAPADVVWGVLTEFTSYARWNPFIVAVAGEPRGGARVMVEMEDADQKVSRFRADVIGFVAGRNCALWNGGLRG
jgi:hypothetical protein